jgi:hypothetical protein
VHAEEAEVGALKAPSRLFQHLGEVIPDPVPMIGESGDGNSFAPNIYRHGLRATEHVEVSVPREPVVGNPGSLVVSGHEENRHSRLGYLQDRLECLEDQGRVYSGVVEEVPAVNHQVHLTGFGSFEGPAVIGKEVGAPPPPLHARSGGEVEAEVGVGQEKEADSVGLPGHGPPGDEEGNTRTN